MDPKRPFLKKVLVGGYLLCALIYFALNSYRITADSTRYRHTHQIQSLILAGESLFFPFFLAYYQYLDKDQDRQYSGEDR